MGNGFPPMERGELLPVKWKKWTEIVIKSANKLEGGRFHGPEKGIHGNGSSTFLGAMLALWMGATRVGVIGHDITKDHGLYSHLRHQERTWRLLTQLPGVGVYNLSPKSNMKSLPKITQEEFEAL